MFATNTIIIDFIKNNAFFLVLLLASVLRIIPPEWAGFWKFNNNKESDGKAPKITPLQFILTSFLDSVIRAFFIPLITAFGLKNMASLIIILVVVFDIFYRHEISSQTVTLIAISILTLYLDTLVERGKKISFFGGLFHWEKDDKK